MPYSNQTRITYEIAKTNGLPFFQVQLVEWARINSGVVEPPNTVTEFALPEKASLFGVSIDPASQIGSVQLDPGWNSLIGIKDIGAKGEKLPPNIIVKPGSPFVDLIPGPIILRATDQSIVDAAIGNQYWSAIDGEAKNLIIGANKSDLVLDCWIRAPGPRGIPERRPDVFDVEVFAETGIFPAPTENLLSINRVSERRRLSLTFVLAKRPEVPLASTCDIRVSLLKAIKSPFAGAPTLVEHQVEPAVAGTYTTLVAGTSDGTLQVDIDDPEAVFVMVHGRRPVGVVSNYDLYISSKILD